MVKHRRPSSVRTLLLLCLLVIGPLQAQIAFACEVMDTVVHGDCCCYDPKVDTDCLRAECGPPADAEQVPCCEVSVDINLDQEARQHTPAFKPPDQRLDVDPPPALITTFDEQFLPARPAAPRARLFDRALLQTGSDTFLVTRRLRI